MESSYSSNSSIYGGGSSSLHSIRRAPTKPWRKSTAPIPPAPPRVYKVDPINFRDLVQKLTAAPEYISGGGATSSSNEFTSRLHTRTLLAPPPPVSVSVAMKQSSLSNVYREFSDVLTADVKYHEVPSQNQMVQAELKNNDSNNKVGDFLGLNPTAHNWCSYPMLSPGTLSTLEQSTVL